MVWPSFSCTNPDFYIRSVPDGTSFHVRRDAMARSGIFRDMFDCCRKSSSEEDDILDLHESDSALSMLLCLLHDPPKKPVQIPQEIHDAENTGLQLQPSLIPKIQYDPSTVIPLPVLFILYELLRKYSLEDSTREVLEAHLFAHSPAHPLQIYGFACVRNMPDLASEASQYLMPIASYTLEEVKVIPTVEAYHQIVRLQDTRVQNLRTLLMKEDIFPHGYGQCPSHREKTVEIWDRQRRALVWKIETGTDVAAEMKLLIELFSHCKMCQKACTAAVEMLAYKCRKVPKRINQLLPN